MPTRRSAGPFAFWFLNHRLEEEELRRQIEEMKAAGFGGFFMHPRAGLLTTYLSEDWWSKVRCMVAHAARVGLEAWLYDEAPFPSGVAGGKVVYDRPEFRARGLRHAEAAASGGRPARLDLPAGRLIGAYALRKRPTKAGLAPEFEGEVLNLTPHVGWVGEDWDVLYRHDSFYYAPYEDLGNPHWRSWTERPFLRLEWTPPKGDWLLCGFVETELTFYHFGYYVDALNPAAVAYFIELTHHEYARRFGRRFGKTIPGIFTDEAKVISPLAWSPVFEESFRRLRGYDLREHLPHLVYSIDGRTPVICHDYRSAVSRMFIDAFCRPIYDWAERHGVASTGHLSPEEDPIGMTFCVPNLMGMLNWFQIPGVDIVGAEIGDARHPLLNMGPKLVSSAAHHARRERVLAEAWAVSGWDQNLRDMKKISDWLFVLGVNLLCTHGQHYSIDGYRKKEAPPSQFYQAPYWPYFGVLSDYIGRTSAALTGGRHVCDVAILFPQTTYNALLPDRRREAERLRELLGRLVWKMMGGHCDFDFISEETLVEARVDGGKRGRESFVRDIPGKDSRPLFPCIVAGRERYPVLILPWLAMIEEKTAERIALFAKKGGKVVVLGKAPEVCVRAKGRGPGRRARGPRFAHVATELDGLHERLDSLVPPRVRITGRHAEHVFALLREKGGKKLAFLFNTRDTDFTGTVALRGGPPRPIALPAHGSLFFVGEPVPECASARVRCPLTRPPAHSLTGSLDLSRDWWIEVAGDNCLVLNEWHVLGGSAGAPPRAVSNYPVVDVLQAYDVPAHLRAEGRLWYCALFHVRGARPKVALVLEQSTLQRPFEILVNGRPIGELRPSRRYDVMNIEADISPLLSVGPEGALNQIAVRVANNTATVRGTKARPMMDALRLFGGFRVRLPYAGYALAEISRPAEKGSGAFCRNGPKGASHKRLLTPFPLERLRDWADLGLPQYSGAVRYLKTVEVSAEEARQPASLVFEEVHDLVRVSVNGKVLGTLAWPPYVLDVTGKLRPAKNEILLEVANSPINMIEAVAKKSGLLGNIQLISSKEQIGGSPCGHI